MTVKFKLAFSIFLIWLFNISGIFGILSEESEWFLAMTPLNLFLYLVFITWNLKDFKRSYVYVFVILFLIGFVTEFLGVNYGYIFGNYAYGSNLGYKIGGVPVMICVNWVILTITTADVSSYIHKNIWIRSLVGAFLMTLLDVVIESLRHDLTSGNLKVEVFPFKTTLAGTQFLYLPTMYIRKTR